MTVFRSWAVPHPTPLGLGLLVIAMATFVAIVGGGGNVSGLYLPVAAIVAVAGDAAVGFIGTRRCEMEVAAPSTVTTHRPFTIGLHALRGVPGATVRLPPLKNEIPVVVGATVAAEHPGLEHGTYRFVVVEWTTTGPLGLGRAQRTHIVSLSPALAATPGPARAPEIARLVDDATPGGWEESPWEIRGLRPYQPGDPRSRVHWRASARTGQLLVREPQLGGEGVVHVVLRMDIDHDHRALSRCRGVVEQLMSHGRPVELTVHEREPREELDVLEYHAMIRAAKAPTKRAGRTMRWTESTLRRAYPTDVVRRARVTSGEDLVRRLAAAIVGAPVAEPGSLIVDADRVRRV